ncbi:hypothetical protein Acr_07g0013100 [Actinidia rufa]|uniref:DUF659 domain-containing protein n=1 Tax=Actinidia rufa TaxID=165716 RepID=A0A7J0EXB8_9ERIC|nr:hypothetical protein Acr_07g0013100 [Actinidia rufa]
MEKSIRNSQSSISFPPKVKKPKTKGPMDTFFTPNPDVVVQNRGKQTKIDANDPYKKEIRDRAVTRFTRWMYDAGISFNARENWVKYGCSIMADGWTDGKGRTLINFLVNCPKGSMFIESIDASSYSKVVNEIGVYFNISIAKKEIGWNKSVSMIWYSSKYNRALKRRYDMRDTIDPISLSNIDESNEWLYGSLDGESDEDEELVFEDDTLTWGAVARASGVGESSKQTRTTTSRVRSKGSTSISNTIHLIDEEDTSSEETEEDAEEYKSNGEDDEDVDLLVVDVEDDF